MTEKQKAVIERARNTPARFITVERTKRVTRGTAFNNLNDRRVAEGLNPIVPGEWKLPDGPPMTATRLMDLARKEGRV